MAVSHWTCIHRPLRSSLCELGPDTSLEPQRTQKIIQDLCGLSVFAVDHKKRKGNIYGIKEAVCSSRDLLYYDFIRAWRMFDV